MYYKIFNKNRSYGANDKTFKTFKQAKEAAILESAFTGGNFKVFKFEPILSFYLEVNK